MRRVRNNIDGGDESIMDTMIGLLTGIFIGTNFGFLVAGLMWGISDDEMLD